MPKVCGTVLGGERFRGKSEKNEKSKVASGTPRVLDEPDFSQFAAAQLAEQLATQIHVETVLKRIFTMRPNLTVDFLTFCKSEYELKQIVTFVKKNNTPTSPHPPCIACE